MTYRYPPPSLAGLCILACACTLDRSALGELDVRTGDDRDMDLDSIDVDDDDAHEVDRARGVRARDSGAADERDSTTNDSDASDGSLAEDPQGLWSPSIENGGAIAAEHTCAGAELSPALSWPEGPAGTATYAVILRNLDTNAYDPTRVLWVIWNIPNDVTSLPADLGSDPMPAAVPGAKQVSGLAAAEGRYYRGPCATGEHRYQFARYALPSVLASSVLSSPIQLEAFINAAGPLETLSLIATFTGP